MVDLRTRTINANLFRNAMKDEIEDYAQELKDAGWDQGIWENFFKKMDYICDHTGINKTSSLRDLLLSGATKVGKNALSLSIPPHFSTQEADQSCVAASPVRHSGGFAASFVAAFAARR